MSMKILHSGTGQVVADIVFVHGLRGDALRTWTKGKVCWPRDLLSKDFPNARIMTWNYDADVISLDKSASRTSLFGHCESLLGDLAIQRQSDEEKSRPIVFVGHSLGGLVIKEAIIRASTIFANNEDENLGAIYEYTAGIVFMAVPHRGSSATALADIVIFLAKMSLRNPDDELLRVLREQSPILENQRKAFTSATEGRFPMACLWETMETRTTFATKTMIVPEQSACFDKFGLKRMPSPGDHIGMCKFSSKTDIGYIRTSSLIKQFANQAIKSRGRSATVDMLSQRGHIEAEDDWNAPVMSSTQLLLPSPNVRIGLQQHVPETIHKSALPKRVIQDHWGLPHFRPQERPYLGRLEELEAIHKALQPMDHHGSSIKTCILSGLCGVGKSETALQYGRMHVTDYDMIYWVDRWDFLEEYLSKFWRFLKTQVHLWLLIIDDVILGDDIWAMLPHYYERPSRVIITTRCNKIRFGDSTLIMINPLSHNEGAEFLQKMDDTVTSKKENSDSKLIHRVVDIVGGIPFLLDIVKDYIELGGSYQSFLNAVPGHHIPTIMWQDYGNQVRNCYPGEATTLFDELFQQITKPAYSFFQMLSFFNGSSIAEGLLLDEQQESDLHISNVTGMLSPNYWNIIQELTLWNLLQRDRIEDRHLLRINAAVQAALCSKLKEQPEEFEFAFQSAVSALYRKIPQSSSTLGPAEKHFHSRSLILTHILSFLKFARTVPRHQVPIVGLAELVLDFSIASWSSTAFEVEQCIGMLNETLSLLENSDDQALYLSAGIHTVLGRLYQLNLPLHKKKTSDHFQEALRLRERLYRETPFATRPHKFKVLLDIATLEAAPYLEPSEN